jgi:hypothetical protein
MKRITLLLLFGLMSITTMAQDAEEETPKRGFKKENLFTGGNVNVSFFNGGTILGLSPYFGYSVNRFIDVAASVNFNYTSQRDNFEVGDKIRQTVFGPGAFVRLFPVNFLFAHAQYEYNFIKLRYIPVNGSVSYQADRLASSVLLGGGYCSGRQGTGSTFYYISVLWDVTRNENSPYIDLVPLNNGTVQKRAIPIIRAGMNIALFQGGGGRRRMR